MASTTATRNTRATLLPANTLCSRGGKFTKMPVTCENPMPMASEIAATVMFFCEKPAPAIIWKPDTMMLPNIMIVQPPSTASGRLANTVPTKGTQPARMRIAAPQATARRLITWVIAMRPMFWANEVSGEQPKTPANADVKPSAAIEPWYSRSVGSRLKPTDVTAAVSPMVSAALTR